MIKKENYCVSCPDFCRGCERQYDVEFLHCDICEELIENSYFDFNNNEILCKECAIQYFKDNLDEFLEEYKNDINNFTNN